MSNQLGHRKRRVLYDPQQMLLAISAVRQGMAKKAAARLYQVPKTTLLDKLSGRVPEGPTKPGKQPTLTPAEETTLVNYAKLMAEIGYPLTSKEFRIEIKRILDLDGRNTDFKDNYPGRQWMSTFAKRHPELSFRTPMGLGHERACISFEMVESWYAGLFNFLKKEVPDYQAMIHDPRRIFNADESGFPLATKAGKVLAPSGAKNVYQITTNTKAQITVLACLNAFGNYMPPMILSQGERMRNIGQEGFEEAIFSMTKSGWMDTGSFVEFLHYFVDFAKSKSIQFPIILLVDGHSTHLSLAAAEYCSKNNVVLYCLLPNATHLLQACDVGLFSPMKTAWKKFVKQWQLNHIGECLTKKDFPALFKEAWEEVATVTNASSGFRKSGLFPLSIEGIDKTKLGPSKLIASPVQTIHSSNTETSAVIASNITCTTIPGLETAIVGPANTTSTFEPIVENVGAYEEVNVNSSETPALPMLSGNNAAVRQTLSPTPGPSGDSVSNIEPIPKQMKYRLDHDYVSPAFASLRIPEPKQKKTVNRLREKLPKAVSGKESLRILREREEQKRVEEAAKLQRKRDREEKKIKKLEEKEKKCKEREEKKRERELKKKKEPKSKKGKSKVKRRVVDSDSNSDTCNENQIPYMDADSDDFSEEFEVCPRCCKASGHPSGWMTCEACLGRWHIRCAEREEFLLLDAEGRQNVEFLCPDCDN